MKNFEIRFEEILSGIGYETNEFQKRRLIESKEPIVIFGAGAAGTTCYDTLTAWKCKSKIVFCDNYKRGTKKGTEILTFDELLTNLMYSHSLIIIAMGAQGFPETLQQLLQSGITKDRIIYRDYICDKVDGLYIKENKEILRTIYEKLCDDLSRKIFWKKIEQSLYCRINMDKVYEPQAIQYFDPCIRLNEEEVFVDCGGYIGDTVLEFINQTNHYKHVFTFEPEAENIQAMQTNLSSYENVTIVKKGVWHQEAILRFNAGGGGSSGFSNDGNVEVPVTKIDALLSTGYTPTFIKMDIEGAEVMALQGASRTIRDHKPKMAVCVYHKPTDMVEIPAIIEKFNSNYSYYLRQYQPGFSGAETVLYAV